MRYVRAEVDVWTGDAYVRAGTVFAYDGPPSAALTPCSGPEPKYAEAASQTFAGLPLPNMLPAEGAAPEALMFNPAEVLRRQQAGERAQPAPAPDAGVTVVRLPASASDDGRDLLT